MAIQLIKARYDFNGNVRRPLNDLKPGDVVHLASRKPTKFTVLWVQEGADEIYYGTDTMGVVYARELERIYD